MPEARKYVACSRKPDCYFDPLLFWNGRNQKEVHTVFQILKDKYCQPRFLRENAWEGQGWDENILRQRKIRQLWSGDWPGKSEESSLKEK